MKIEVSEQDLRNTISEKVIKYLNNICDVDDIDENSIIYVQLVQPDVIRPAIVRMVINSMVSQLMQERTILLGNGNTIEFVPDYVVPEPDFRDRILYKALKDFRQRFGDPDIEGKDTSDNQAFEDEM